jgi:2-iminoacetate synthase ThiH
MFPKSFPRQEVEALEALGHKRLLLLTGEHPKYPFELFLEAVSVVSSLSSGTNQLASRLKHRV